MNKVVLTALFLSLTSTASAINISHYTTTTLTCRGSRTSIPNWYMNGDHVFSAPLYTSTRDPTTGDLLGLLTISGNESCRILQLNCTVRDQTVHTERLIFEGSLSTPENVNFSNQLEWKPPYYTMNQESDVIHVDPHITHYTVYTIDVFTGRMFGSVNVTETSFAPTNNMPRCPMHQVSAWNAGGEGELSELIQNSIPQTPLVENIHVTVTVESGALHFHIEVNVDMCTSRMPEFFLVTLMSGSETTRHHQRDFTISPPPNVDVCTIRPRISAGNAAGTSSIETVEVVCSGDSTDSTTTASTDTVTTVAGTGSGSEGNSQQGNNTTLIAISIGVIAVTVGVLIAAATVMIICCRKYKRRKVDPSDQTDARNYYSKSPSLGGPPVTEVVYASRLFSRDPESTAVGMPTGSSTESGHSGDHLLLSSSQFLVDRDRERTQSSNSTESTDSATSSSSTGSGGSGDPLLPPSSPASAPSHTAPPKNSQLLYAQLNVKQTQVHPPSNDDLVHYAQIEHQES